jgi:hypothetical protein
MSRPVLEVALPGWCEVNCAGTDVALARKGQPHMTAEVARKPVPLQPRESQILTHRDPLRAVGEQGIAVVGAGDRFRKIILVGF